MKDTLEENSVVSNNLPQEIANVIREQLENDIELILSDYHENDIANALPLLTENERKRLYSKLSNEYLSDIFAHLEDPAPFIEELSENKLADIITEMASDDAVDLLEELDEEKKHELIDLLDEETAHDVELISAHSEEHIGSLMTNDFVCISKNNSIKQAMRSVIDQAGEMDNISTIFVCDDNGVYCGAIRLRDLVIARANSPLEDIIINSFPFVYATSEIKDTLSYVKEYAEPTLPVLDSDNRLIGALTSSDIVEVLDDELTEDYAKLAGLSEEEFDKPANRRQIFSGALKRLPWLIVLLVLDLFIGAYIGIFEAVIVGIPFIVSFQQMVSGMSGNTGTQTLANSIKMLASDDLQAKQKWQFVFKEFKIGFLIGLFTGVISTLAITLYAYLTKNAPTFAISLQYGLAVGIAMLVSASVSTLTGSLIPITLNKIGADPAVASGPLITTLNDLIAITLYYGTALILLL